MHPRPPIQSRRRLECATAWVAAGFGLATLLIGLIGPRLGGDRAGLPGPFGFASETIVAGWMPFGILAAAAAALAALRRRWGPTATLLVVALVVVGPDLLARSRPRSLLAADGAPTLRVASANLAEQNRDDPFMVDALRALDADVLVLPEYTHSWEQRLAEPFADDYPYRHVADSPEIPGCWTDGLRIAVWSRIPTAGDAEVRLLSGDNAQLRIPLRWHDHTFALYAIHPRKPYPYSLYDRTWSERNELLDWIETESLPTIVAGDLNAPPRSAFLDRLRGLGLTSASETRGAAPATWPMDDTTFPPFGIALDHILHSDTFATTRFATGPQTRSDHLAVIATLRWLD